MVTDRANRLLAFEWCLYIIHLTLAHSKGQSQGRAHFDCEYLVNGDRINIAIVNTYEVAYWLSNRVFTYHLDPFYRSKSR